MTPAEVIAAADENFVVHVSHAPRRILSGHVVDGPNLVLVDSGLSCDTFNVVCRARLPVETANEQVREATTYFRERGRPFSWWTGSADRPAGLGQLLSDAGLERAETELVMAADLAGIRGGDPKPHGLRILRVRRADELEDFARVNAANWSPPDPEVRRFYELAAQSMLDGTSPQRLYVGYLDGEAVATAELSVGGGVVGLYNISTLEAYRRQGFGTALTLTPLHEARSEGFRTAVLQAAADGIALYRRVGFESYGTITEYKPPAPKTTAD